MTNQTSFQIARIGPIEHQPSVGSTKLPSIIRRELCRSISSIDAEIMSFRGGRGGSYGGRGGATRGGARGRGFGGRGGGRGGFREPEGPPAFVVGACYALHAFA